MKLTDFPRAFSLNAYDEAICEMVERLKKIDGVLSVYQIGGVSTTGISDIDLLVIFDDDATCEIDPRSSLDADERYLYIHDLYGMSESFFLRSLQLPFFHAYLRLWGKDHHPVLFDAISPDMKTQIGLEYLVKMYINMTVERTYGIMKVRGLLLHVKALLIDAEYIGISAGRFMELLDIILDWRGSWYENRPANSMLRSWHSEFYTELSGALEEYLANNSLFIPLEMGLNLGRNLKITQSSEFSYQHSGITLPSILGGLGRKYFNIQNRMNDFEFMVPLQQTAIPADVLDRHNFITEACSFNADRYPHFIPVAYGLAIYTSKDTG